MAKRDDKNKELFGTCKPYLIMSVGNTLEQSSDVGCCIELSRTDLKDGILYHGHGGEYLLMVFVLRRNSNRFCFYETNQNIGRLIFAPGKNFEDKKRISFGFRLKVLLLDGWESAAQFDLQTRKRSIFREPIAIHRDQTFARRHLSSVW